jgi:hypothetical protein
MMRMYTSGQYKGDWGTRVEGMNGTKLSHSRCQFLTV